MAFGKPTGEQSYAGIVVRGPCRVGVRGDDSHWSSRLVTRGAASELAHRLPDAEIAAGGGEGPWDLDFDVLATDVLGWSWLARRALAEDVITKRLGTARIAGWVPGEGDPYLAVSGLGQEWTTGLVAIGGNRTVVWVDPGDPPSGTGGLPAWASDADRAAVCSGAAGLVVGAGAIGALSLTSGQAILCGYAGPLGDAPPGVVAVGTPEELVRTVETASSERTTEPGREARLEAELDRLAERAASSGRSRAPYEYHRWASGRADAADASERGLRSERQRRSRDRARLGEASHRLAFVQEQFSHTDYARARAEAEAASLRASKRVRLALRFPGIPKRPFTKIEDGDK